MTNSQYDEVYPEVQHMLSWQNAFPAIQPEETTYRYVKCTNRHYQKAPTHFSINLTSCDNNPLSDTCHPGSIIEGFVHLSLESPLAAQYIKLVFKAAGKTRYSKC
jgi:hypothetical protein